MWTVRATVKNPALVSVYTCGLNASLKSLLVLPAHGTHYLPNTVPTTHLNPRTTPGIMPTVQMRQLRQRQARPTWPKLILAITRQN
jgi:hypothetical protein